MIKKYIACIALCLSMACLQAITTSSTFDGASDPIWREALTRYLKFRKEYLKDPNFMNLLAQGQEPQIMVVACSDSRVDPALILQTHLGDLFMVRNVANIVPSFDRNDCYQGTCAALEYGINVLKVKHLIILGHSQCGGVRGALNGVGVPNDFITHWISQIEGESSCNKRGNSINAMQEAFIDDYAKKALNISYNNSMTFPWIKQRVDNKELVIHLWFFDIKTATIFIYSREQQTFKPLNEAALKEFLISQGQKF